MEKELYAVYCVDQEYLSDASVVSMKPVSEADVGQLRHAQTIIEGMWLHEFPTVVILHGGDKPEGAEHLYDATYLLMPEEWTAMDSAKTFLLNRKMLELCKLEEPTPPYVNLTLIASSGGLRSLFEEQMFVCGAVIGGQWTAVPKSNV